MVEIFWLVLVCLDLGCEWGCRFLAVSGSARFTWIRVLAGGLDLALDLQDLGARVLGIGALYAGFAKSLARKSLGLAFGSVRIGLILKQC